MATTAEAVFFLLCFVCLLVISIISTVGLVDSYKVAVYIDETDACNRDTGWLYYTLVTSTSTLFCAWALLCSIILRAFWIEGSNIAASRRR